MGYTTASFFCFVAIVVFLYFLPALRHYQWRILLISSLFFYACTGLPFMVFILAAAVITYFGAIIIEEIGDRGKERREREAGDKEDRKRIRRETEARQKAALAVALILLFGILVFLKYEYFVLKNLGDLLNPMLHEERIRPLYLVLPLGISFYTFQAAGYVIDISRGKIRAERNFFKILLFLSFFPQITQGPISFYDELAHQLYAEHEFDFMRLKYGLELILWGYFKKSVIGDRSAPVINHVMSGYENWSGTTLFLVLLVYAVQLYADFSAGIDISRGIAEILGIDMAENFRRPYFSRNINEYWRRWHITLGAWMKNYVFYPIAVAKWTGKLRKKLLTSGFGKGRLGKHIANMLPSCIATMVVFIIVGMWHGASWRFLFFGIYNGVLITVSMMLTPVFEDMKGALGLKDSAIPLRIFQHIRTLFFILLGYVFDIAPSLREGFDIIRRIFVDEYVSVFISKESLEIFGDSVSLRQLTLNYWVLGVSCIFLLIVSVCQERTEGTLRSRLDKRHFALQWACLFIFTLFILSFGAYGPGYDIRGFVYTNF